MKNLILFLAIFFCLPAFAQNYYIQKSTGTIDTYDWKEVFYGTNTTVLINRPANDVYSAVQQLPFPFSFYGKTVTHYKASDNGYITFDTGTTIVYNAPTALPSAAGPKNAIYGFWMDMEAKWSGAAVNFPTRVYSYTYGNVPNRVHVIHWFGLSRQGEAITGNNLVSFAIRLFETSNRFDVVFNGTYWSTTFKGAIGCENSDGTLGVAEALSPQSVYPNIFIGEENKYNRVYEFVPGVRPDYDVSITQLILPDRVHQSFKTRLKGVVTNYSKNIITDITVNYRVNNYTPVSEKISGLTIASEEGQEYFEFSQKIDWSMYPPDSIYRLDVWVSAMNGTNKNQNTANDHYIKPVINYKGTLVPKNVLLEESSGAWCGNCPQGNYVADVLHSLHPNYVCVVHHDNDSMANPKSDIFNTSYAPGYPSAIFDRIGKSLGNTGDDWVEAAELRGMEIPPLSVNITNKNYDSVNGTTTFTVTATFVEKYSGDLHFNAMIIEDKVRGNDIKNVWTQRNYYSKKYSSGGNPTSPFYNEEPWLVGYYHNNVVREILSDVWGDTGGIPATVLPAQSFSKTYTYILPAKQKVSYTTTVKTPFCETEDNKGNWGINKPGDISLVGFISDHTGAEIIVLNAVEEKLVKTANTNITKPVSIINNIYPNPASNTLYLNMELTAETDITVDITTVEGKVMQRYNFSNEHGNTTKYLDVGALLNGIYVIKITSGDHLYVQKILINR